MFIFIEQAEHKGDYKIAQTCSDSLKRNIDFDSFILTPKNPMTRKYVDKELFQSFSIEYGDLI